MSSEPDVVLVAALRDALHVEADQVQASPDARADLLRRARQARRTRTRRGPLGIVVVAAVLAVALAVLLVQGGFGRSATPAPAVSPTDVPTETATTEPATPTPTPSSTVAVSDDLPTTLVYYPSRDGRLHAEPRLRTTLTDAVAAVGGEPSDETVAWPFGAMTGATASEQDGVVVVDYTGDSGVRPSRPNRTVATFWTQGLVHTVASYLGRRVPVRVTLNGQPFQLFDVLDTSQPFVFESSDTPLTSGLTLPAGPASASPQAVVGALGSDATRVTWTLTSLADLRVVAKGSAPVHTDQTFGFSVAAEPGEYEVTVKAAGLRQPYVAKLAVS